MSKKAVCFILAIMLTVSMFTIAGLSVYAEAEEASTVVDDSSEYVAQTVSEVSSETLPANDTTTVDANGFYPNLTVNAISNYFPRTDAEYNSTTQEVIVTYWLKLSKDILNTQWYVTYDPNVLSFSEEKNSAASVCPTIGLNGVFLPGDENTINYCASSIRLFDFSSQSVPYVKLIFDVNNLDKDSAITTTVDLTVDTLVVSDVNPETLVSDTNSEVTLVENCEIIITQKASTVDVEYKTMLTNSSYVAPTTVEQTTAENTPDQIATTATESFEPQESVAPHGGITDATSVTSPEKNTNPTINTEKKPTNSKSSTAIVETGDSFLAGIFLAVLIFVTGVLFVMRKREMIDWE